MKLRLVTGNTECSDGAARASDKGTVNAACGHKSR